ncbi:hypothetical protein MRX96_009623 [Rhipicephalus microplus]
MIIEGAASFEYALKTEVEQHLFQHRLLDDGEQHGAKTIEIPAERLVPPLCALTQCRTDSKSAHIVKGAHRCDVDEFVHVLLN